MLGMFKEYALTKGVALLKSEPVSKLLESEKFGLLLEKAITIPVKVSGVVNTKKEQIVSLLELATQNDVDELKRSMMRVEKVLREIKDQSSDLLQGIEQEPAEPTKKIVE